VKDEGAETVAVAAKQAVAASAADAVRDVVAGKATNSARGVSITHGKWQRKRVPHVRRIFAQFTYPAGRENKSTASTPSKTTSSVVCSGSVLRCFADRFLDRLVNPCLEPIIINCAPDCAPDPSCLSWLGTSSSARPEAEATQGSAVILRGDDVLLPATANVLYSPPTPPVTCPARDAADVAEGSAVIPQGDDVLLYSGHHRSQNRTTENENSQVPQRISSRYLLSLLFLSLSCSRAQAYTK